MKALILSLVSVMAIILNSPTASAHDMRVRSTSSRIIQMNLNQNTFGNTDFSFGDIVMNKGNRTLSLILKGSETVEIKLPITAVNVDNCGSVVYKAVLDRRPVDGSLQELHVMDHQNNHCPSFVAMNAVNATYLVLSPHTSQDGVAISTFVGDSFLPMN